MGLSGEGTIWEKVRSSSIWARGKRRMVFGGREQMMREDIGDLTRHIRDVLIRIPLFKTLIQIQILPCFGIETVVLPFDICPPQIWYEWYLLLPLQNATFELGHPNIFLYLKPSQGLSSGLWLWEKRTSSDLSNESYHTVEENSAIKRGSVSWDF